LILARGGKGGEWIVCLDHPDRDAFCYKTPLSRVCRYGSDIRGCGATPELAYMNMLEKTADRLYVLYGFAIDRW
jgi:hypothetical protein